VYSQLFPPLGRELDRDLRGNLLGRFTDFGCDFGGTLRVRAYPDAATGTVLGSGRFDLADRQFERTTTLRALKHDHLDVDVFQR